MRFRFVPALALAIPAPVLAAPVQPAQGMLQMLFGLVIVLGMLIGAAWLLKRFSIQQKISGGAIKVIAGAAVGQRERIVLVEVGDTWLLVGVAPGHVSALHTMPKADIPSWDTPISEKKFSSWLKQVLDKRA